MDHSNSVSSSPPPGLGTEKKNLSTEYGLAEPTSISPCSRACPLGIDVQRYVGLAHRGLLFEALQVIEEQCPMPGVCGTLCQRPCESACRRGEKDHPVAIRWLKSAAARAGLAAGALPQHLNWKPSPWRVAIVGAGPAGLGAAQTLGKLGHRVTLFERRQHPGGLLDEVIPAFQMPRRLLRADIEAILGHPGVELQTGVDVGHSGHGLIELREQGFAAIIMATGAGREAATPENGVGGKSLDGVVQCLKLLRVASSERLAEPDTSALVMGNTTTAVTAARILARAGWAEVTLVAPRPLEQWPADPEYLEAARREGVKTQDRFLPQSFEEFEGHVISLEGHRADSSQGRPKPQGELLRLPADLVVTEARRTPDVGSISKEKGIELTSRGALQVDPLTLQTTVPGLFAAGECATGPKTVVEALAMGKRAALMADRYLSGRSLKEAIPQRAKPWFELMVLEDEEASLTKKKRLTTAERRDASPLDAANEASRCLRCGPCSECDRCMPDCRYERVLVKDGEDTLIIRAPSGRAPMKATLAAIIDSSRCTGCGRCESTCPHQAVVLRFRLTSEGELLQARVDRPACRGCGRCVPACPFGAIELAPGHHDDRTLRAAIAEQVVG